MLRLHHRIAPFKVAVLPLSKKPELVRPGPGGAGPRSRTGGCATTTRPRPSAAATAARTRSARPYCITFDFDSLEDKAVTVRERDTMDQVRLPISDVAGWLADRLV